MTKHDPSLDKVFQALADPTRRGIVARLGHGPASVSELAAPLPMALPTVLAHLAKLEACGLITSTKCGRTRTCTLNGARLGAASSWIDAQRRAWEARLDRLEAYLDATAPDPAAPAPEGPDPAAPAPVAPEHNQPAPQAPSMSAPTQQRTPPDDRDR